MRVVSVARMRKLHWSTLTSRELDILLLGAEGLSNEETGKRLFLTNQTIKFHRTNLFRKLGAKNIAHAVAIGFRTGLIPMDNGDTESSRWFALKKLKEAEDAAAVYARVLESGGAVRGLEYEDFRSKCDDLHDALKRVFE